MRSPSCLLAPLMGQIITKNAHYQQEQQTNRSSMPAARRYSVLFFFILLASVALPALASPSGGVVDDSPAAMTTTAVAAEALQLHHPLGSAGRQHPRRPAAGTTRRALRQAVVAGIGGGGGLFGREVAAPALITGVPAGNINSATVRLERPPESRYRWYLLVHAADHGLLNRVRCAVVSWAWAFIGKCTQVATHNASLRRSW